MRGRETRAIVYNPTVTQFTCMAVRPGVALHPMEAAVHEGRENMPRG